MNNIEEIEKDPKGLHCKVLKFDLNKIKNLTSIKEFFELTGVMKYINNKTIYDVRQTYMNNKTGEEILKCLTKNWCKCKDVKGYRKKYAVSNISFNWMNYAPIYNENIPENEIHIYPKKKGYEIPNTDRWQKIAEEVKK